MKRPVAGALAVLFAVSVWGGATVIIRFVDHVDGLVLGFHRLWVGAVATVAIFYATGRRLSWRTVRMAIPGGLAFAGDLILYFSAVKRTTIADATVVGALQPVLVMLVAGPLFGEAVTGGLVLWSVVAMGGVAIAMYGSSGAPVWSMSGDLMAVGALFAWTGYFIFSKRVRQQVAPFEYLAAMMLVAVVVVAPVALLSGQRLDPGGADAWAWIVLLAIGSGGVGHLLVNWAHEHVDLTVMSLLTLAIPVFASASAVLFLDESMDVVQVVGMAVVIAALAVVVTMTSRDAGSAVAPAPASGLVEAELPE
jgi:drug/metabolite transporter (DMT)-like permease